MSKLESPLIDAAEFVNATGFDAQLSFRTLLATTSGLIRIVHVETLVLIDTLATLIVDPLGNDAVPLHPLLKLAIAAGAILSEDGN